LPKRLSQKLILSLTAIVVLIAAISGYLNVANQQRHLLDSMILGADQLSKGITSATWHAMMGDHRETAYQIMQAIATTEGIDGIRLYNRTGQLRFSTDRKEAGGHADRQSAVCSACHNGPEPRASAGTLSRVRIFRGVDGRGTLAMVTPIYNDATCSQSACHAHPAAVKVLGVLDVSLDLDPVDREVRAMQLHVFLVTTIEILLIGVFIFFFTRRFLTIPIRGLIEGTKAVSAMKLDKPIEPISSSEELSELAQSFNAMRERLAVALGEINQFTQSLETKVEQRTQQLKAANQKLMQNDRLVSLGQLAASVAHEINNPVSSVLNFGMLLQRILNEDGVPPDRLPEFRRYLANIVSETSRVGRIVSDLLSFARRSKPQSTATDLNRVVKATLSLVSHKLKMGNVEAELDLEENLPALPCDPSQIQQVIMNLLFNAAEAAQGRGHGHIGIKTGIDKDAGMALLTIRDDGEGIAPGNLARIFDPFFTTKAEGKGVGLGLAVSYGIVHAHGGDIEVESKLGEGSAFTVSLPLSRPQHAAGMEEAPESGEKPV
jgi:two-component system NtrC family sensor kinase